MAKSASWRFGSLIRLVLLLVLPGLAGRPSARAGKAVGPSLASLLPYAPPPPGLPSPSTAPSLALPTSSLPSPQAGRESGEGTWERGRGVATTGGSSTWQVETVDGAGDVGRYASLALDQNGRPRISYLDRTHYDLKYAYYDGTAWQFQTVDSAGDVGGYTSLALDSSDRPHISYYDYTHADLKYAYYDGTAWITQTVDSAGEVGRYTSLALDAAGRPHIAYEDYTNRTLKYAYFDGITWQVEMVASDEWGGWCISLAPDTLGRPHISYCGGFGLKYAHYHYGSMGWWGIETVDSTGWVWVGDFTSLALETTNGWPRIAYFDGTNTALKYACRDDSAWITQTVDSAGWVGEYPSLALDRNGRPHSTYFDYTNTALKYACHDGADWQIETVDGAGEVGQYTSLALDQDGGRHVAYYDYTNRDLKYAYAACTPVESVGLAGPDHPLVSAAGLYTATYAPISTTLPVVLTWDNGAVGPTAVYSWTQPGTYTITVTAANPCGTAGGSLVVEVRLFRIYLPLVLRG